MKKLVFILISIIIFSGCQLRKPIAESSQIIYAVDSSGVYENPNDPGIFYKMYDTVFVRTSSGYDKKGNYKTKYKILNK